MFDTIFSWETHSTLMCRISIWFFYRAHNTLQTNWNNIPEISLLLKMKKAWKRNPAKLIEFPATRGCFRFPAFAGFWCQSWFGCGGWTDTQLLSDLSEVFQLMQPFPKPHLDSPADTRSDHPTFLKTNDSAVSIRQSQRWRMYMNSDVIY